MYVKTEYGTGLDTVGATGWKKLVNIPQGKAWVIEGIYIDPNSMNYSMQDIGVMNTGDDVAAAVPTSIKLYSRTAAADRITWIPDNPIMLVSGQTITFYVSAFVGGGSPLYGIKVREYDIVQANGQVRYI